VVGFDAPSDAVHHRHCFDRIIARRTFRRQHYGVCAFVDCSGDVAHFGPGRAWRGDHRFQHLGRDHHRLAQSTRLSDDPVLRGRNALGRELDAKVAAGDHHRVGDVENRIQPLDRSRLFDLGEQAGAAADQFLGLGDIFGTLDETQGDPVNSLAEREFEVAAILVGQRRDRHDDVGHINALAVGNTPANLDISLDPVGRDFLDPQADLAVVDQKLVADVDRLEQLVMGEFDPGRIAGSRVTIEDELLPVVEHRFAALEVADPQLRPLQVHEDRRRPVIFLLQRANRRDQGDFSLLVAMAHVKPEGVRSRLVKLADHLRAAARRPKRCEDSHLAGARGHGGCCHAHPQ
jgi:hypothetical protein